MGPLLLSTTRVARVSKRTSPTVPQKTMLPSCHHLQTAVLRDRYPNHPRATPPRAARGLQSHPLLVYQLVHHPNTPSPHAVSRSNASAQHLHPLMVRDPSSARAPRPHRLGRLARSMLPVRPVVRRRRGQDRRLRSLCRLETVRSTSPASPLNLAGAVALVLESSLMLSGDRTRRACPRHSQRTRRTHHTPTPVNHRVARRNRPLRRNPRRPPCQNNPRLRRCRACRPPL